MIRFLTATALSCTLAAVSLVAATPGQSSSTTDPKIGTRITIRGCLHEGTSKDSYVLLGMTERPAAAEASDNVISAAIQPKPASRVPLPIYWLDSTQGLKERIGQIIDITGEVQEKKTKTGTITITSDPSDSLSRELELESGTKSATTEKSRPAGATPKASTVVLTRKSYFLSVELVHSVTVPAAGTACK